MRGTHFQITVLFSRHFCLKNASQSPLFPHAFLYFE